jgi:hypothetical protein
MYTKMFVDVNEDLRRNEKYFLTRKLWLTLKSDHGRAVMTALWKRLTGFVPLYAKSPTRLSLLGVASCIAALIVLERESFSIHDLSVAAGIVVAIGCLIYTPPRGLGILAIVAVGGLVCYEFDANLALLTVAILVGLCCWAYWFTVGIAQVNELLLKRMDYLQEKLEEIESKQDGM